MHQHAKKGSMPTLVNRMIRRITREGHLSGFTDEQVLSVLRDAKQSLEPQPAMLEIDAPILIFGDVHGQLRDLLRFFTIVGPPPQNKILFLGDYVDRCKKSFEVIMLLLCYRIKYPHLIYLLRGNHECSKMNRLYGFYEEMRRKRNVYIWKKFQEVFNELPLCAVVSSRLLCMHGGISPEIQSWDALINLKKPKTPRACDEGVAVDLMWSDPSMDSCTGFQFNATRATSYIFGGDTIENICNMLDISMVVRAHEVVKGGHQFMFDRKLITVFSAPNYCGTDGNAASVMKVSRRLELSFITLKPRLDTSRLSEEKRLLLEKMLVDAMAKSPDPYSRLSTTGKNEKNESGHIDDSSLIGPPPVPGQVKPPAGKKDDCSTDMNDLENDKPPTNLVQQQPHPSYSYTPLVKEEFIKGVQYGTKDSALNNSSMIISPKKRDTTPSPPSYSTSPSKGSSPAPNVKAGSSKSTKPDMLKTNTNNTKDLSSSAATSKTVGPQTKACVKPISPHTKATPISPVTKVTAVPLHKPISPKIQSLSTRPNTKNSTESENSSSSSSTSLLGSVHQSRQPSKIPKPQSVAEATKNAMVSTRTPPQPHPKSPFEIINATEKALRSPRQA